MSVILLSVALPADPNGLPTSVGPSPAPAVISLAAVSAKAAAALLRTLYPHARIKIDQDANAIIVIAGAQEVVAMRTVVAGIDIRDPRAPIVDVVAMHSAQVGEVITRLQAVYPKARFVAGPNKTIVVAAQSVDMQQIKAIIATIDMPPTSPTPKPLFPTQTLPVVQADPRTLARDIARTVAGLRVAVSGSDILVSGSPESVNQAKTIVAALDHPSSEVAYAKVYRLHSVDARSVADLLTRSFRGVEIEVDRDLNAITAITTTAVQDRLADAIAQLDVAPNAPGPNGMASGGGGAVTDVVRLHAAVPAANGQASTTAADIAQSVMQGLAGQAGDLKIIVHPNSTRLILTGSAYSVQLAKDLIAKLDVAEPLVELDTEVYEVDEGLQKQLGLKLPTAALSTTYSEQTPTPSTSGVTQVINGLLPLGRTPLSLQAQLDLLVSTNRARILENPRITTFSGRTASLRAGETVNVLTTAGGGTGTVATTQIQSFQTGVTLDITPVVNSDDYVTITLHPAVNTEAGVSAAGVPNIQTRDTTTTVGLHDGETIVVGGLIEDTDSRTVTKIPILGELPIIGRLFQDVGTTHTRNELVVTVTPHIIRDGFRSDIVNRDLPLVPTAPPLPPLAADATLPPRRSSQAIRPAPAMFPPVPVPTPAVEAPGTPTPVPAPVSSAFTQTNVYTFGSPPPNNYADSSASPQIFYLQVKPTVIRLGQPITITVVTTSNVSSLTFGTSATDTSQSLGSIGPGKWQGVVTINPIGTGAASGNIMMFVNAATSSGATVSLQVPFSLAR